MESLFKSIREFRGVKHMNCGATKHTEQQYKYAIGWLRYRLHGALHRLLQRVRCVKLSLQLMPGYSVGYAVP
jgi:hypothetical protein